MHKFIWTSEYTVAFEKIKIRLVTGPLLHPPDMEEFFVWTDASEKGFGAVLKQEDTEGKRHQMAYASRATCTHTVEQKYALAE